MDTAPGEVSSPTVSTFFPSHSVCFLVRPTLFTDINGFLSICSERRAQKATEIAERRAKGGQSHPDDGILSDEDASAEDELESEDPRDAQDLSTDDRRKAKIPDFRSPHTAKKQRLDNGSRIGSAWAGAENTSTGKKSLQSVRPIRPKGRADIDIRAPSMDASGSTSRLNRRLALGFADLATLSGRYVSPELFQNDDANVRC